MKYYPREPLLGIPSGPPLFEGPPVWGELIRHGDRLYSPCMKNDSEGWTKLSEVTISEDTEKKFMHEITCPACGHEQSDSWERRVDSEDDDTCGFCGATIAWEREVEVTYSTTLVKLNNVIEIP